MTQNQVIDEKLVNFIKQINIPKNPLSFYLNSKKIEKELSETIKDYFYKAINEFITPDLTKDNKNKYWYSDFLFKLYYYSGFTKNMSLQLNKFLNTLKFYDIEFYLDCAIWLDSNIKHKLKTYLNTNKNLTYKKLISEFTKFLKEKKEKDIEKILVDLEINITEYPLSYNELKISFDDFFSTPEYKKFKYVLICFAKVVRNYNREYDKNLSLIEKVENKVKKWHNYSKIIKVIKKGKILWWKKFSNPEFISQNFNSISEARKYLITYLINKKTPELKNYFYFYAIKNRLSENEWANIGWINLFSLQKNNNADEYNMILFFKNFKDTLIELSNSIFWPIIKPYFYYILIFKAIKLPLKDWQKLFFLLMFFSAESYEEYTILRSIYIDIENIGLWDFSERKNIFLYYLIRFIKITKIFFSSFIIIALTLGLLWGIGVINIVILGVIAILLIISFLRYVFFPYRFEILKNISLIVLTILWYIWFTSIFPKLTDPQYLNYIWNQIKNITQLNFDKIKTNYENMMSFIYWKNYNQKEKTLITNILQNSSKLPENPNIKKILNNTKQIVQKYTQEYYTIKKWEYLKLIVDRQIKKIYPIMPTKYRNKLSKAVIKEYIKYYCSNHKDYYCKTKLERIPVWFKINLTKINKLIQDLSGKIDY